MFLNVEHQLKYAEVKFVKELTNSNYEIKVHIGTRF